MKSRLLSRVAAGTLFATSLALPGCGGSSAETPPKTPEGTESPAEGAGATGATDGKEAAKDPAEPGAAAGDDAESPPADVGEGDTRTTEAIAAVVKANRKQARECYEKALKQIPGLKGDVVIHFTLTPAGKVKAAELNKERSTITEASVASCVMDVIHALEFPKSSKGLETTVNYPFNFTP